MNKSLDLKKALQYLSVGKIVPEDVLPSKTIDIISDEVIKHINEGSDLIYDEMADELYIFSDDGERVHCPDLSDGISESTKWLVDYLPDIFFDIDQGGNTRKSQEASSLYKLICLGVVIKSFAPEISEHIKAYDFEIMASKGDSKFDSFQSRLQSYQDLNSVRLNSIFSAAAAKLSLYREKSESYYTGMLSQSETSKLESLSRSIKSIISDYERNKSLNPTGMEGMSKISKLTLIDERDSLIEKLVEDSEVSILYKITKLNSERIPAVIKAKVYKEADRISVEESERFEGSEIDKEDVRRSVKKTIVSESFRAIIKTIKAKEIMKYKENPSEYSLKTKS